MRKTRKVSGVRIEEEIPVIAPATLLKKLPLDSRTADKIVTWRNEFRMILNGKSKRIVIMVGPCSIHNHDEAVEYGRKLAELAARVSDKIFVMMRVYFEKPRTTIGWKGLIVDPHLTDKPDFNAGLTQARKTLLAINALGLPTVTEFLGPIVPRYISDLIVTGTIGARTTESQTHREMASGLSMPIGFKNGTDGSIDTAINALISARHPHSFLGISMTGRIKTICTTGNPDGYIVLRGGKHGTNFDSASVSKALEVINKKSPGCRIVVDCSHENSGKKHEAQSIAFDSVLNQIVAGEKSLAGLMLESNLEPGRQDIIVGKPLLRGVSVTDACIGWDETKELILRAHKRLK